MDCSDVRSRFIDYIDGDLDERDRRSVESHVAECYLCKEEFADLENMLRLCKDALRHPHPVDRFDELRTRLPSAGTRYRPAVFRRRLRVSEMVYRLAVAALVAFMVAVSPAAVKGTKWLFSPLPEPGALSNGSGSVRFGLAVERSCLAWRHRIDEEKMKLGINGEKTLL